MAKMTGEHKIVQVLHEMPIGSSVFTNNNTHEYTRVPGGFIWKYWRSKNTANEQLLTTVFIKIKDFRKDKRFWLIADEVKKDKKENEG